VLNTVFMEMGDGWSDTHSAAGEVGAEAVYGAHHTAVGAREPQYNAVKRPNALQMPPSMPDDKQVPTDRPQFVMERLFSDPTPHGIINQRVIQHLFALAREHTDMTDEEQQELLRVLMYLARKLAFTWIHLQRFKEKQAELVRKLGDAPDARKGAVLELEYSEVLFQEFDEFAVQLKSTLDHLVKAGVPVLGKKTWTLRTFGDNGRDVVKALQNNAPRRFRDAVHGIREMLLRTNEPWLASFIAIRDRVNHFVAGGLRIQDFGVHRLPDGTVRVPMWNDDQPLADAMDTVWNNLLRFCEDFVAVFLHFRHKPGLVLFHGPESGSPTRSPWRSTTQAVMDATLARSAPGT